MCGHFSRKENYPAHAKVDSINIEYYDAEIRFFL